MKAALFIGLILIGGTASAGRFLSAVVSENGSTLTISSGTTTEKAPKTRVDQDGFGVPKISTDGRSVGWTVLIANCCTSYPLPRALVIYQQGKAPRTFDATFSIWHWHFLRGGTAIAYAESLPHGLVPTFYQLVRIRDGKTLSGFQCWPGGMEGGPVEATHKPEGKIPSWVQAFPPDDCRPAER
jgi:hypothetical protein